MVLISSSVHSAPRPTHALPAPAVLPVVLPHGGGVALETFRHEHFFAGAVGKSSRLGPLRLRRAGQKQGAQENRRDQLSGQSHRDRLLCNRERVH